MKNTTTNYSIVAAENGFIVTKATENETQQDDSWSSSYTNETYVFGTWDDVLEWLKANGK